MTDQQVILGRFLGSAAWDVGNKLFPGTPMVLDGVQLMPICIGSVAQSRTVALGLYDGKTAELLSIKCALNDEKLINAGTLLARTLRVDKFAVYTTVGSQYLRAVHPGAIPVILNHQRDSGLVITAHHSRRPAYSRRPPLDRAINRVVQKYYNAESDLHAVPIDGGCFMFWPKAGRSPRGEAPDKVQELAPYYLTPIITTDDFKESSAECFSHARMQKLFRLRRIVEVSAASQLAAKMSEHQGVLEAAEQVNNNMRAAGELKNPGESKNPYLFAQLDLLFHRILLVGMTDLDDFLSCLRSPFGLMALPNQSTWAQETVREHEEILKAIRKGPREAKAAVRRHLKNAWRRWQMNLRSVLKCALV